MPDSKGNTGSGNGQFEKKVLVDTIPVAQTVFVSPVTALSLTLSLTSPHIVSTHAAFTMTTGSSESPGGIPELTTAASGQCLRFFFRFTQTS